jgi:predicted ribonuclease YlaK
MGLPSSAELFYGLALSEEQKAYADSIFDYNLTITDSISGSGKTTIAVGCAKILKKPLYYFFSPVQEEVFGYTPGDEEEKQSKYLIPLTDALRKIKKILKKSSSVRRNFVLTHGFMRLHGHFGGAVTSKTQQSSLTRVKTGQNIN